MVLCHKMLWLCKPISEPLVLLYSSLLQKLVLTAFRANVLSTDLKIMQHSFRIMELGTLWI